MSFRRTEEMYSLAGRINRGDVTGLRNLQKLREAKGITRAAMADAIGASADSYRSWEQKKYWPGANWLPAIAAVLECGIADLF